VWAGSLAGVVGLWRRHRDLLDNAGALLGTTAVTAGLGFFYWAFAARLFSQQAVGFGSAAISTLTLLGTIGMFGLGTLLIGELPQRKDPGGLVSAALITASVGSLVLGAGFALVAHVSGHLAGIGGTPGRVALFSAGVVVTAFTLVVDQGTIGIMHGGIQLARNAAFAVAKLAILPGSAFILHDGLGTGIECSWVAGMALSMAPVAARLRASGMPLMSKPDWRLLQGLGKTALAHNWLNLSVAVPILVMPVVVTATVSASANAAYYVAWMLAFFLYSVPANLSTVLFAIAAADPAVIAGKLRFSLRLSFAIGTIGVAVLGAGAHLVLGIFGPGYARAAYLPLMFLLIGYFPMVPRSHYIAVCRARGKITRAAAVLTLGGVMEVAGAVTGARLDGLTGLSALLLGARLIEGAVTAPTVIRAALAHGRPDPAPDTTAGPGRPPRTAADDERDQTDITLIISLAASTAASQVPLAGADDTIPFKVVPAADQNMTTSKPKTSENQPWPEQSIWPPRRRGFRR
jgi:O-antigen/teichoic acid export membrane protein